MPRGARGGIPVCPPSCHGSRRSSGFQGVAIHDDVLGRPVGAGDGQLVGQEALVLRGVHRTGFQTDADFSHVVRLSIHRSIMFILASRPITNR